MVKTGDVIEFYNAVFIPATKSFLLQLGNKTAPLATLPTLSVPGNTHWLDCLLCLEEPPHAWHVLP